ncbi:hypothetical protein Trco_004829 [Trichoderma cornu-damae]|uniref:Uncharacterized protein n=1 Tax=Trichoderma cornu-damae TaxID=654480 RepID=A0A9P8TS95_9HYPO|nr:hypothetical protein Trco_004829 [Trichoderma cornu-damae]
MRRRSARCSRKSLRTIIAGIEAQGLLVADGRVAIVSIAFAVKGSSNRKAITYTTSTPSVRATPAGLPKTSAVPKKFIVEPQYIGADVTLKGKPVTISSMRMPK